MATGPIETHLHRSFNWENGAPGPQEGPRGRSANCGNGLFAQCVRLRSEINLSALLYWGAVSLGLVSNFYILVSGTFPIFVQGFVQCLDPRIWVFTIVLIVVMAVVWYPFFKVYDNQLLAQEQENAAAASAEDAE